MRSSLLLFASLILVSLSISSCQKEGCTDPNATNYDPEAKSNDGTCRYEGQLVFWYGQLTAQELALDFVSTLTYYVDDVFVGTQAAGVFWPAAPECGQDTTISVNQLLGSNTSRNYTYEVDDQTGSLVWSGSVTVNANQCMKLELVY